MKSVSVVFIDSDFYPDLFYGCFISSKVPEDTLREKLKEIDRKYGDEIEFIDDYELLIPKEWECTFVPYKKEEAISL